MTDAIVSDNMKKPIQSPFLLRKDLYRIWFEFYKLARQSTSTDVRLALKESRVYYAAWGDVLHLTYDNWWRTHQSLFAEPTVKVLSDSAERQTANSLLIEVPLNESSRVLLRRIKQILDYELGVGSKANSSRAKRKIVPTKSFIPTKGEGKYPEPKVDVLREVLTIYKHVYLSSPNLRGRKLLDKTHAYYKSRKVKKDIPYSLRHVDTASEVTLSLRNLRRWITWAQRIELNVARGEFPGKY